MNDVATTLFHPGENCSEVAVADRIAFIVDGDAYFDAFAHAAERARRSILIVAWDFDSRTVLRPGRSEETVGEFLNRLADRNHDLRIRVLDWDYPMIFGTDREFPPIYGLDWQPHRHVEFRYDDTHPLAGSHHQKIVVIDDRMVFNGGLDITNKRWDSAEHIAGDPRRTFKGVAYPPLHDVMVAVDGEAGKALARIARERWCIATGEKLESVQVQDDPWPAELNVDLTNASVAVACTAPPVAGKHEGIREIECLYLETIARARKYIYFENQYFTSPKIADALAQRLAEPDGPEIVLVTRLLSHGWLEEMTMHVLRTRLVRQLREKDKHGRFHAFCPHVEGLAEGTCVDLHSKVMVVDDEWLRVGSSNLSNRSMGVDTECDVIVEARGEERVKKAIRAFRDRLLAEHAGVDAKAMSQATTRRRSMGAAIRSLRGDRRWLRELEAPELPETALSAAAIADPERPISLDGLMKGFADVEVKEPKPPGLFIVAAAILIAGLLALMWRYTPLSEWVTADSVIGWTQSFAQQWWAPLVVILAYTPAMVVMFPRPLITVTAVVTFGPGAGFAYAMTGVVLAAIVGYCAGEYIHRDTVRRMAGRRINRLSALLKKRGFLAVMLVRLVPVAPFVVVSVVMGAMRIRLRDYVAGTMLGMAPGMLAATVLSDQLAAALDDPSRVNVWAVGSAVLALAALAGAGHWWLGRAEHK